MAHSPMLSAATFGLALIGAVLAAVALSSPSWLTYGRGAVFTEFGIFRMCDIFGCRYYHNLTFCLFSLAVWFKLGHLTYAPLDETFSRQSRATTLEASETIMADLVTTSGV